MIYNECSGAEQDTCAPDDADVLDQCIGCEEAVETRHLNIFGFCKLCEIQKDEEE